MGKQVDVKNLKPGDVVKMQSGNFVIMRVGRNRRASTTLDGAYEKHLKEMLKDVTDTKRMKFYVITPRVQYGRSSATMELVGKVPPDTVKKMIQMNVVLHDKISQKHGQNLDALDIQWGKMNDANIVTQKGERAEAGDVVMVQFSNGKFEMVLGNDKGAVYDGKTGRYYCREPWKVGQPSKMKLKYHPLHGVIPVESKSKARSMPPNTLLYIVRKKSGTK